MLVKASPRSVFIFSQEIPFNVFILFLYYAYDAFSITLIATKAKVLEIEL